MSEGDKPARESVEVLVGYLVTHADGFEARLAPDRTRAELYAAKSHATIEPMFVKRPGVIPVKNAV